MNEILFPSRKKTMLEHLTEVKELSISKIPNELKEAYEIVAVCHDFGKYTSYFQRYLKYNKKI